MGVDPRQRRAFLKRAKLIGETLDDATRATLTQIIDASADRIKLFSDIIAFAAPILNAESEYSPDAMKKAFADPKNPQPERKVVPLWPDKAPGAVGDEDQDRPTLTIHLPDRSKATGTGMIVCPGGGYTILVTDHEGQQERKQ